MDIPAEWMKELSAQERTVLYLYDALYQLLEYLQAEYVFTKVDVGFLFVPRPLVSSMRIQSFVDQHKTVRFMDQCLDPVTAFPAEKIQSTSTGIFMQEIHNDSAESINGFPHICIPGNDENTICSGDIC